MKNFEKIDISKLDFNVFDEIGGRMLLVTAQDNEKGGINAMTASWGAMGILWNKPVCLLFIRPQRYTKHLIDECENFSVNVLKEGYSGAYKICGTLSGKDTDKIAESGLTPVKVGNAYAFEQSGIVLELKKLYTDTFKEENFNDKSQMSHYGAHDFHVVYVCEIVGAYAQTEN